MAEKKEGSGGGDVYSTIKGVTDSLLAKGRGMVDALFPPEKRQELLETLKKFATTNPKLSAFLLTNVALSGLPLFLFILFSITVFVFSLIAALLIAVVAALLFTVFCLGVALCIVLPTVFITTLGATFLFLWGLGGYYIVKWFSSMNPAQVGEAVGDKLNNLTGGKLDFLMQGIRNPTDTLQNPSKLFPGQGSDSEKEPLMKGEHGGGGQEKGQGKGHENENPSGPPKLAKHGADAGKNAANGVRKGAGSAANATTGTLKGVANGVAG